MIIVVIALATGILLSEYWLSAIPPLVLLAATAPCVVAAILFYKKQLAKAYEAAVFVAITLIGGCLHNNSKPTANLPENVYTLQVRLDENITAAQRSQRAKGTIMAVMTNNGWTECGEALMIYLPKTTADSLLRCGTVIECTTRLQLPIDTLPGTTFCYRNYLHHRGISYTTFVKNYSVVDATPHGLKADAARLQAIAFRRLQHPALSIPHQSVANAMLLGVRDASFQQVREQYNQVGILHLLCLSGLHVGLFAAIMRMLLSMIGNRRWQKHLRATMQIVSIWIFVLCTGMAPSAQRAALMFSFFAIGDIINQRPQPLDCLSSSALVLLVANPSLLFQLSFQLSYSAMAGIVLLYPCLANLITLPRQDTSPWQNVVKQLYNLLCLSASAQLFSMPFIIYTFHTLPTYSLIANLLIVPFAAVILTCAILIALTTGFISNAAAWLLDALLDIVDGLSCRIASLPHSTITIDYYTLPMALLTALALLLLYKGLKATKT